MTVWAQQTEVRQLIIHRIAINVVQVEGKRLSAPLVKPALNAPVLEEAGTEGPAAKVPAVYVYALAEVGLERALATSRKLTACRPPLSLKVRCIKPKARDMSLHEGVGAAARTEADAPHDACISGLGRDRLDELVIGPASFRSASTSIAIASSRRSRPGKSTCPGLPRHV